MSTSLTERLRSRLQSTDGRGRYIVNAASMDTVAQDDDGVEGTAVVWAGEPFPLGTTYDGRGTNFSVFSETATKVEVCLFDEAGPSCAARTPGSRTRR